MFVKFQCYQDDELKHREGENKPICRTTQAAKKGLIKEVFATFYVQCFVVFSSAPQT